jgi:hypothetical protein
VIYKAASSIPDHVQVTFELPACIWADRIFLVGDFNAWNESATPMHQDRDGVWRATIDLPYGSRCEFRYLIDGQWKTDYHADGFTANVYGSDNSVVEATLPQTMRVLIRKSNLVSEFSPSTFRFAGARPAPVIVRPRTRRMALNPVT